ncbi:prolyl oligopeptidase family serine peptidase [Leptobacterium flavescens]|uniref:Prolyl oligopeptidase family serine peptidase n=1 Tax=Leptobacterium flavescens TaxID=472055 RepID=A0A6P0UMC3_9FLAO|nr:prolyl oligopeptidase family serine peptidase [Leptobacterium flavescens]NER14501.1 prolyl oligopeptidase family serine peptidase [Leptobacterium flavescens]
MIRKITLLAVLFSVSFVFSQKKAISHDDYDLWKNIGNTQISDKGKLMISTVVTTTGRGDGYLMIYNTDTKSKFVFHNGYDASVSADENYVVFKRKPKYQDVRKEKKKKVKKDDREKDMLFVYDVKNNRISDSVSRVKKYELSEKGAWAVIEKFKNKKEKKKKEKGEEGDKKKDTVKKKKSKVFEQDYALVYNLKTGGKDTLHQIKDFALAEEGPSLYYSLKKKKGSDIGVYAYDLESGAKKMIDTGKYAYDKLITDKEGKQFAYMAAKDSTETDSLKFELYHYTGNTLNKLTDISGKNLKKDWELSKDISPYFSETGKRLFFYSRPEINLQKDTTLLDEEVPQVDVWNWKDELIQPEQKSRFKQLKERAFVSYYSPESKRVTHLQDEDMDFVFFDREGENRFAIGVNSIPYSIQRSWESPWRRDFYVIDANTGQKHLALSKAGNQPVLSPDGNYALYYDVDAKHWFSIRLSDRSKTNLTDGLGVPFYDEDDDHPSLPPSHGFGGFDADGNALIYDKYDVWKIALDGKTKGVNISANGRKDNIVYRVLNLDPENRRKASYLNKELLLTGFDKTTKASGLYSLRKGKMRERMKAGEYLVSGYVKAKDAEVYGFRKQNFTTYPDLYLSKDSFRTSNKVTDVNPQQKDFKWGTAELFSWKAYDGTELEGIIYKPENFDPSKKYPVITYFYEKRSDTYRNYRSPQPSASTVNSSYLVSNDYIMFVPDIVYKDGKPGPSAYNCIVSGVDALVKEGYIDTDNMALQGQSWGGYQVAYLITVTDKFKAAMAGAPVSNMTSAYGGIRWQSGLSRAFQYERTQSRLGKNLWEGFDLYIENSPLFGIPKIKTPLLMMHNDNDGAVPYYQGIEMFMGMRRLQKPAWLLVYNDEAHNLRNVKNRQDLSIRMMQFFDHYLKGEPAPKWMTKGVPRTEKGIDFGYDLDKE